MREAGGEHWFYVDGQWRRGWCHERQARDARKLLGMGQRRRYVVVEAEGPALWEQAPEFLGTVSPAVEVSQG
jgi:hypothetical protein